LSLEQFETTSQEPGGALFAGSDRRGALGVQRAQVTTGEQRRRIRPKGPKLRREVPSAHLQDHQEPGERIVSVNDEARLAQVFAGGAAEPADHFHPAVIFIAIDVCLTPQVVIEMNLIPGLGQPRQAVFDGLDPDGRGIFAQEGLGACWVVVKKQEPTLA
jgi:hypothetical protein